MKITRAPGDVKISLNEFEGDLNKVPDAPSIVEAFSPAVPDITSPTQAGRRTDLATVRVVDPMWGYKNPPPIVIQKPGPNYQTLVVYGILVFIAYRIFKKGLLK